MDERDVPNTPEWRPLSSLSGGAPSTAPSSNLQLPHHSPPADHSSTSSGRYSGTIATSVAESTLVRHNMHMFGPAACAALGEQIRAFSSVHTGPEPSHDLLLHINSLSGALREAESAVRHGARWFAQRPLADLLEVALEAAAASSASADLYAAITLVDAVGTYSSLPPQSLYSVARFLSQTYYNATRANKTQKLADAAWTTTERILHSHNGRQYIAALLKVITSSDAVALDGKIGYARFAGAVKLFIDRLLTENATTTGLLEHRIPDMLKSFQSIAAAGNEHSLELVMEAIQALLENQITLSFISTEFSWSALFSVTEICFDRDRHSTLARQLVDAVLPHVDECHNGVHSRLAQLCINSGQPLDLNAMTTLLASWSYLHTITDYNIRHLEEMIMILAGSDEYVTELTFLVAQGTSISEQASDRHLLAEYADHLRACIESPKTQSSSANVLVRALIGFFIHYCITDGVTDASTRANIFQSICNATTRSMEAATFIMDVRADTRGYLYATSRNKTYSMPNDLTAALDVAIMDHIKLPGDWQIYSHISIHLPQLLGNQPQFGEDRILFIRELRVEIVRQLNEQDFVQPPTETGLTKSHVAARLIEILVALTGFHRHFSKQENNVTIRAIIGAASSRDYVLSIPCVHALTICCYELPDLMSSHMDDIIEKLSRILTRRHLPIHVLLFLAELSRLPDLFRNFQTHDFRKIFRVCGEYLQSIRGPNTLDGHQQTPSDDTSSKASTQETVDVPPRFVHALAHHVIAFWYIAIQSQHRSALKDYIITCLTYTDEQGEKRMEDQGIATIDMMDRVDIDEWRDEHDEEEEQFQERDGRVAIYHRLVGMTLVSTETALRTGKSILTVRRPSGTAKWVFQQTNNDTNDLTNRAYISMNSSEQDYIPVFPDDRYGKTYGSIYIPRQTVKTIATADGGVKRAIQAIDRIPGLDSHKAGVIYIGEGQSNEAEILQNVQGSPDYVALIEDLGALRRLKDAKFNTQGLDRSSNSNDGPHAVVWSDAVTELVFHVTTLMPNNDDDALNTSNKKRHIGNDFVNIIFNNSGASFNFDTFPAAFNAVYIVISPSARTSFLRTREEAPRRDVFYRVEVLVKAGYPAVSSAAQGKIVSGLSLPGYVRNLALNECVFSAMWHAREGEYSSSWRARLDQLRLIDERYAR